MLANTEAVDDGYDEALLLDASGFVSEGAGENIFVIKNGVVFCPNPKMPLWSSHPKVFIDLSHEGRGRCPYCGTTYQLAAGVKIAAGH
jgi:uncharacterized Zn-finger protein